MVEIIETTIPDPSDFEHSGRDKSRKRQRSLKKTIRKMRQDHVEQQQIEQNKKATRYSEVAQEAKPHWDKVRELGKQYLFSGHFGHDTWQSTMSSLVGEFLMHLALAMEKQKPNTSAWVNDILGQVGEVAAQFFAGAAGGIAGGVAGMFGVGKGMADGAKRAMQAVSSQPIYEIQYNVEFRADGKLDPVLIRSDGKVPTSEQWLAYLADIDCWMMKRGYILNENGSTFTPEYVPNVNPDAETKALLGGDAYTPPPPLDAARFNELLNNEKEGLWAQFADHIKDLDKNDALQASQDIIYNESLRPK